MPVFLFLLSAQKASGQTTIAFNLTAALQREGKNVRIVSLFENPRLESWQKPEWLASPDELPEDCDALWILTGQMTPDEVRAFADARCAGAKCRYFICTTLEEADDADKIAAYTKGFEQVFGRQPDLIIPNKLKAHEWENNSRQLFALGDAFGYEKITDLLPECSRIHELPLDRKTVWEVPVDQIRLAFEKLLTQVKELL